MPAHVTVAPTLYQFFSTATMTQLPQLLAVAFEKVEN